MTSYTISHNNAVRRRHLLGLARSTATQARRDRRTDDLAEIRRIGAQLDALDPAAPEAPAVLDAARIILTRFRWPTVLEPTC